jgi:hypothetical protein
MFKTPRLVPAMALLAATLIVAPACATHRTVYGYPSGGRQGADRAYSVGYERGQADGERDARSGRRYDYARHSEYRDAGRGNRGREGYRDLFRQGFVAGYDDGYRRFARRGSGRSPRPPAASYPDRYPRPGRGPAGGYVSPAGENGFRDGLEQGREDSRDRKAFDPRRAKRYREGDHDYDSRYGSRDAYKRDYRNGFQRGYEQGFRGGR